MDWRGWRVLTRAKCSIDTGQGQGILWSLSTLLISHQFIRLLGYFKFIYFLFFIRKFRTQKDFQYHSEPYKTPPADRRLRDLLESSESTWRGYELFEYHLLFLIRWNAIWNSEKLNIKKMLISLFSRRLYWNWNTENDDDLLKMISIYKI